MASSENMFKPGDIITNLKDRPDYSRLQPTLSYLQEAHTFKVSSLEPNGDYNLIELDTATATPLIDKYTKEEKKDFMSKIVLEYPASFYKKWDADYVKAVYKRAYEAIIKENENKRMVKAHSDNVVAEFYAKKINSSFTKNKSIEETAKKFKRDDITIEDVWNVIDSDKLKSAIDYSDIKRKLFCEAEKFETATQDIVKDNQNKNASAKSVLGNEDLNRTIKEYLKTSKKGGKTSKKRRTTKKRERKSEKV
jgi:hypothetical protein